MQGEKGDDGPLGVITGMIMHYAIRLYSEPIYSVTFMVLEKAT